MFGFKTFGAGLVLGGAMGLFATNYHVVQTNNGMVVLPRSSQPPLRSAYVDVRKWNLAMWEQYSEVASALVKSGRTDLMVDGTLSNLIPNQVQPSTLEQFGQSVSEKTKEAYKSLVPIKFTNQAGEEVVLPNRIGDQMPVEKVPVFNREQLSNNGISLGESAPIISTPLQYEDAPVYGNLNQVKDQLEEIKSKHVDIPAFSLPQLQDPIPIGDDPFQQVSKTVTQFQSQVKELPQAGGEGEANQEWVKGLLKTLIPQDGSVPTAQDYGQAELPYHVDAPNPLDEMGSQTTSLLQKQMQDALPTFKPF